MVVGHWTLIEKKRTPTAQSGEHSIHQSATGWQSISVYRELSAVEPPACPSGQY